MQVQPLAFLSGFTVWHCHELWYRKQMLAQIPHCCGCGCASSCTSNLILNLGTSICHRGRPKNKKKKIEQTSLHYIYLVFCYNDHKMSLYKIQWEVEKRSNFSSNFINGEVDTKKDWRGLLRMMSLGSIVVYYSIIYHKIFKKNKKKWKMTYYISVFYNLKIIKIYNFV